MSSTDPPYRMESVGELTVLRWPGLDSTGAVDAIVTTRHGGCSTGPYASLNLGLHVGDDPASVLDNRSRAASVLGLGLSDLVFCRQAHGPVVATVSDADRGRGSCDDDSAVQGTDALVTSTPGVGLVVMVADCVPIVLVDPEARVLACVHAGWQGTTKFVTEAAIVRMTEMGATPERIVVGMGPAIPGYRYQVGDEVLAAATAAFGDQAGQLITPDGTGRWLYDLWAANQLVLAGAGVDPANVHLAALGTETDDFFSDRLVRPCGRFAAIATLRP